MIVAFWNVNMGRTSNRWKRNTFGAWLAAQDQNIDLLFLEEFTDDYNRLIINRRNFSDVLHSRNLDPVPIAHSMQTTRKSIDPSRKRKRDVYEGTSDDPVLGQTSPTKSIYAFGRSGTNNNGPTFNGTIFTMRGADDSMSYAQRRAAVKVNVFFGGQVRRVFIGLHANASNRAYGALEQAGMELERLADKRIPGWAGGDFNYHLGDFIPPTYQTIRPRNWNNQDLPFTQWNWNGGTLQETRNVMDQLDLSNQPNIPGTVNRSIGSHERILDYLLAMAPNPMAAGPLAVQATPLPMCNDARVTFEILRNFDHFPIVYNIPDPEQAPPDN